MSELNELYYYYTPTNNVVEKRMHPPKILRGVLLLVEVEVGRRRVPQLRHSRGVEGVDWRGNNNNSRHGYFGEQLTLFFY